MKTIKIVKNSDTGLYFDGLGFNSSRANAKSLPIGITRDQINLVWSCPITFETLVRLDDRREMLAKAESVSNSALIPSGIQAQVLYFSDCCKTNPEHIGNWSELAMVLVAADAWICEHDFCQVGDYGETFCPKCGAEQQED